MCFSAGASFTAGALLSIAGIMTLMHVPTKAQRMIASIPLLFGIQQIAEGLVWIGLQNNNFLLISFGTYIFIFFASVIWPLWIPLSFHMLEPKRSLCFIPSLIAGLLVAFWFFIGILPAGISTSATQCNIVYTLASNKNYVVLEGIIYLIATVLPCFIVHDTTVKVLGIILLASYALTYFFYLHAFISVWCFCAAILSVMSIIIAIRYPRIRR